MILSSFSSKSLASYVSFATVNDKEYLVEIDETKQKSQVSAENMEIAIDASYKALIDQKAVNLENEVHALEYESIQSVLEPVSSAKELANKINYVENLFGIKKAKVPWWPLALKSPEDFKLELLALEDAWKYRNSALNILELSKREQNPKKMYEELCLMEDSILQMTAYMKNLKEVSKTPADIVKRDEFKFMFETVWKTFNFEKLENTFDSIEEKYNLKNKEVEKLKADMEKYLEESSDYGNFRKNLINRDITKIIKQYEIILEPVELMFYESFKVPLFNSLNPKFQTEKDMETAKLEIKLEKSMPGKSDYNLRLWILSDKFLNKTKTSIFLFQPSKTHIGTIDQKAYNLKNDKKLEKWEEIVPYGQDKSIVMQLNAVDWLFDKAVLEATRGNTIKIRNLLNYFSDKIYDSELSEDARDVEQIIQANNGRFSAKQIRINPVKGFRQTQGYLFLIPVNNEKLNNLIFYINAALQSGSSANEEAFGRLEDIVISLREKKQIFTKREVISEREQRNNLDRLRFRLSIYYDDFKKIPKSLEEIEPFSPKSFNPFTGERKWVYEPIPEGDWIYDSKEGELKSKSHPEW